MLPELLTLSAMLGTGATACLVVLDIRSRDQRRRDARRRGFVVGFPRTLVATQERAFLQALMGLPVPRLGLRGRASAVLEVVSDGPVITHYLRLPEPESDYFVAQLRALVPGVTITEINDSDALARTGTNVKAAPSTVATELRLRLTGHRLATTDPAATARTILAATSGLHRGERVVWQWILTGGAPLARADRAGTTVAATLRRLTGRPSPTTTVPASDPGLVQAVLRVGATAAKSGRARELAARLTRAAGSVAAPGTLLVPRALPTWFAVRRLVRGATPLISAPVMLSLDELVALLGWPLLGPVVPGLTLGGSPQLPVSSLVPRTGRILGRSTVSGRPVAQPLAGAAEHMLVTAPTGAGKTWLAVRMVLDDIAAGRGCLFLDPKGKGVQAIIERLPEAAISRVVLVDPTDEARPVPLPIFTREGDGIPELAADGFIGLLRHRFHDLGPRSSDILSSSLYALAATDGATLFDLLPLWSNAGYRASVVATISGNPALASFFAWFDALSPNERNFVLAAPMNKLRPLLQRPVVRNVLAAPRSTFTIAEALRRRLIVLVTLPEGALGPDATTLLGQVVLARAWSAVQARRSAEKFFAITVDESSRFLDAPTDLGDVLARAREYGVGVHLLSQSLSQLPAGLRDIALNSARTKISFQTSRTDAVRLAGEFGPLVEPDMLASLGRYEAIGQVSLGGTVSEPFTFTTDALGPPVPGRARAVRTASRQTFGVPRAEIEASFTRHQQPPPAPPGPIGRQVKS